MIRTFAKLLAKSIEPLTITWRERHNPDRTAANAAALKSVQIAVAALIATDVYLGGLYAAGYYFG